MDCCWLLPKILLASEPPRTATPIGKSASDFKLRPLTLLATLDDELLEAILLGAMLDAVLDAILDGMLDVILDLMLDAALEQAPTSPPCWYW